MPLSDADWRAAEPRESFIDLVYDVFADRERAYSAEELFKEIDVGRFSGETDEMVDEFETALELLVHEGALEKRMYAEGDGSAGRTTYYRVAGAGTADVGG